MDQPKKLIEEKFSKSQNALVLQQSDLSLDSVSKMIDSGAIDISPKYQRRERWKAHKEAELIESFLLNIPVPPIYLSEDEYGTYSVIDGKQRLTSINKFLNGKLKLKDLARFPELEGYDFASLPPTLANALKIRPYLRVITLLRQSDADLKHEVFLRLNKSGVSLNAQEIRNVAFRGHFNDLLLELSDNPYLSKQLKSSKTSRTYREMIDVQYVLRFFTVKEYWNAFPGNMDIAMDTFMKKHYRDDDAEIQHHRTDFEAAIDFCSRIWGADGFKRPGGNNMPVQGFYDIQMVCSSLIDSATRTRALQKKAEVKKALVAKLKSDEDYYLSATQFTSNPKYVFKRISDFCDILRNI